MDPSRSASIRGALLDALPLALERALAPADYLRRRTLRGLGRLSRPLMNDRELRIAVMGSIVAIGALVGTVVAPLWMLALGPIVLGVPHILSDIRYLWVRPGYDRRAALILASVVPLLYAATRGGVIAGLCAAAGAVLVARAPWRRRAAGLCAAGLAIAAAYAAESAREVVFAHLHNAIAIGLWWGYRRRASRLHYVPLFFVVGGAALLLSGAIDATRCFSALPLLGPGPRYHAASLAPGLDHALALRLVLVFCFAQSVHYGVWLRLIPEEDRDRATPRTFAASFRALYADLGPTRLVTFAALAIGLAVWALVNLSAARNGYLRFALFHGQLELVAAALLWTEGRRPAPATEHPRARAGMPEREILLEERACAG